jgi:hypothetical protein
VKLYYKRKLKREMKSEVHWGQEKLDQIGQTPDPLLLARHGESLE